MGGGGTVRFWRDIGMGIQGAQLLYRVILRRSVRLATQW